MKNLFALIIILLFSNFLMAQQAEVSAANRLMSKGTNPSFMVELPDVTADEAEKAWKQFIDKYKSKKKTKKARKTKEFYSPGKKMPRLSSETVDVYATITENSSKTDVVSFVTVWFDLKDGFLSATTSTSGTIRAEELLQEFAVSTFKKQAENLLKEEEKDLKKAEGVLKDLEKDNKSYHKKIEEAKAIIAKMEKKIEANELEQKKQVGIIENQKKQVDAAKDNLKEF